MRACAYACVLLLLLLCAVGFYLDPDMGYLWLECGPSSVRPRSTPTPSPL